MGNCLPCRKKKEIEESLIHTSQNYENFPPTSASSFYFEEDPEGILESENDENQFNLY